MESQSPVITALDLDALEAAIHRQYDDDAEMRQKQSEEARSAIVELIAADLAFDAAQDAIAAAKKAKGSWSVNPLGHGHPAVLAMRNAKERRRVALARAMGAEANAPG